MNKSAIRTQIKQMKRQLDQDKILELSDSCIKRLIDLNVISNYEVVCPYVSYNQELATLDFIKYLLQEKKRVAVPKIIGTEMEFCLIHSFSDLKPGAYGILEPENTEILKESEALIIMPGLAFDQEKNRIGYGGGYYDKYLKKHKEYYKIALAYDFQIFESIETEDFDIKPDIIVTDKRVIL